MQVSPPPPLATLGLLTQTQANAGTEANESKAGPKGQDFRCIRIVIFGHWSECNESNESNVGVQGQDF